MTPAPQPAVREPRERPEVWCELCGCDLPDEFANDAFPMCGECVEGLLEAGARDTL
jgi:hypothetical protein